MERGYASELFVGIGDSVSDTTVLAVLDVPDLEENRDDLVNDLSTANMDLEEIELTYEYGIKELETSIKRNEEDIIEASKDLEEKKNPDYLPKINSIHASSGTESAILETLKSSKLKNLKKNVKVLQETENIEKIFTLFATDADLISIGVNEVSKASKKGAIEELFLADILIRGTSKEKKLQIEEILTNVENSGGKFHILSSEHPTGQQIIDLGEIVAILRYKL